MSDFVKGILVGSFISAWVVAFVLGAIGMTTIAGILMLITSGAMVISSVLDWLVV